MDDDTVDPAAFKPYPAVVKAISADAPQGATRAAEGAALDQLAGGGALRDASARAPRRATAAARPGGIEVIRGGRAETVAW
jgi:pilus assembly protein CpaB